MNALGVNEHAAKVVFSPMNTGANAYVYAIVVDGVVRYIGKGTGRRIERHVLIAKQVNRLRASGQKVKTTLLYNKLAAALRRCSIVETVVLVGGLSEPDAYGRERREVASRSGLWNTFAGGIGCTSEDARSIWARPGHRSAQVAAQARPDVKHKKSEAKKARWNDPEYRRLMADALARHWNDPEARARHIETTRDRLSRAEVRAKLSAAMRAHCANPEVRKQRSDIAKSRAADPVFTERHRQAMVVACSTDAAKAVKSAASKRLWLDPERRKRQETRLREMWTPERRKRVSDTLKAFHAKKREAAS